jgi:hypothetical protein
MDARRATPPDRTTPASQWAPLRGSGEGSLGERHGFVTLEGSRQAAGETVLLGVLQYKQTHTGSHRTGQHRSGPHYV